MSELVSVQTLRGNAGIEEAQKSVTSAVAKYNEVAKANHEVVFFQALAPNTKGMQFRLSLLAQVARLNGCNLIRLNVHNGNVALCGPADQVQQVQEHLVPYVNAIVTQATAAWSADQGPRMGFINGYTCGMTSAMYTGKPELVYGIGTLFQFPKPGSGTAYDLGAAALVKVDQEAPAAPKSPARKTKAAAEVAA